MVNMVRLMVIKINNFLKYFQIIVKPNIEDIPQLPDEKKNGDQLKFCNVKIKDEKYENRKEQEKLIMPRNPNKSNMMQPSIALESEMIKSSNDFKSVVIETTKSDEPSNAYKSDQMKLINVSNFELIKHNNGFIKSKNVIKGSCQGAKSEVNISSKSVVMKCNIAFRGISKDTKFEVIKSKNETRSEMMKPCIAKKSNKYTNSEMMKSCITENSKLLVSNRFTLLKEEPCLIKSSTR